jgi:hypothetical protein
MSLTRRTFSALSLGALLVPEGLRAQTGGTSPSQSSPTVVELFTSQGCSSCPAADALMLELTKQAGMIPLTYPVEIWDYLGWKDTLAKPGFTRRQRAYAAMVAGKRVYTPQTIVNGAAHCVGSDLSAISRLKASTSKATGARLAITATGNSWAVTAIAPDALLQNARLILLPIASRQTVQIGRGENSGRTITYANVVRDLIDLGPIGAPERKLQITAKDIAADKADGFALLLQTGTLEAPAAVLAGALVDSSGIKA